MNAEDILKATKQDVLEHGALLQNEVDNIKIQIEDRKGCDHNPDWHRRARVAMKIKQKDIKLCGNRVKIINAEGEEYRKRKHINNKVNKALKSSAKDLSQSLERAIIEEIKILVSPGEFLESVERAKRKIDWENAREKMRVEVSEIER